MGFSSRIAFVIAGATVSLGLSACSPVEFGSISSVNLEKASPQNDSFNVEAGLDNRDDTVPAAQDDTVSLEIPNYRECQFHESNLTSVYSPKASSRAKGDVYFAFMNIGDSIHVGDDGLSNLIDQNKNAEKDNSMSSLLDESVVVAAAKTSLSSGLPRYAQIEQQRMAIKIDKDAYNHLIQQALDSKKMPAKLKTVFIAFEDVNHDGKFTPGVDEVLSSSVGIPSEKKAVASLASVSSKSTFVDASSSIELKFQARTQLMMIDARKCAEMTDVDQRSICEQSCDEIEDPLVLDLSGNGFHATSVAEGVKFDIDASGAAKQVAWLAPGSQQYFLALDKNSNGRIDDGSELFGLTPLANGLLPSNGFESLKALDSNGDDLIDSRDEKFGQIVLWDGDLGSQKLMPISRVVASISLEYKVKDQSDEYGNRIYAKSIVKLLNGQSREIADIWFAAGK